MNNRKRLNWLGGLGVLVVTAAAVAVSLPSAPAPQNLPWPTVTPSVPQGNRPVGPGSYGSIPEATAQAEVPRPAAPVAPSGQQPVAPGSYTSIPAAVRTTGSPDDQVPVAPNGQRPVGPGSYTSIPDGN